MENLNDSFLYGLLVSFTQSVISYGHYEILIRNNSSNLCIVCFYISFQVNLVLLVYVVFFPHMYFDWWKH